MIHYRLISAICMLRLMISSILKPEVYDLTLGVEWLKRTISPSSEQFEKESSILDNEKIKNELLMLSLNKCECREM